MQASNDQNNSFLVQFYQQQLQQVSSRASVDQIARTSLNDLIDQALIRQEAAYAAQQAIERKEAIIVGVNAFEVKELRTLERLAIDPAIELAQKERLRQLRQGRDAQAVEQLLARLSAAASGTENLMPLFIECVEHDITLGEICNVMREVFGEYQEPVYF